MSLPAPAALEDPCPAQTAGPLSHPGEAFYLESIAPELARAEEYMEVELRSEAPYVRDLLAHLGHYRGKRLRPALLLLSAQACGGIRQEHLQLAAVVEMIHSATLVHDDVLDQAELRRHVATVNFRWGNASSVLLGDLLFTHAFHLASQTGSALACRIIGEATNRVCEGELRQIGEQGNLDLSTDDYFSIVAGKTAALTSCCCRLGALFAGADSGRVQTMAAFGHGIGMAFQIADDILDLVGSEKATGKSLGTDLLQKKLTLPMIHLLSQNGPAGQEARDLLDGLDRPRWERLRLLLLECGSIVFAQREAERHVQHARAALEHLPHSPSRRVLEEITRRVVHRAA